jgi:uncharacterized membrane protein
MIETIVTVILSVITFIVFTGFFALIDLILLPFAIDAVGLLIKENKKEGVVK